jgi:signal transduction histidine kinase/CheY-like chemotaxis protein
MILTLIGVVLMSSVFLICTDYETKKGDSAAENALDFLKLQCLRYDNMISSDDTSDLVQILDKAFELKRCLAQNESPLDTGFLSDYAGIQRLSGIIITDNEHHIISDVCIDNASNAVWDNVLIDKNVTDLITYPQKTYMSHLQSSDGSIYDYAAIASADNSGIILCYARQALTSNDENQIRIENLLAGYRAEMDAILFITDGETILSSNDTELVEKKVSEYPIIANNLDHMSMDRMSILRYDGTEYLVRYSKCKGYYLHVLLPAKSVFSQRLATMAYFLVVYILFLLIFSFIKQREANKTNRIKMEFLHQMSHDIRTPINGIRGMIRIGDHFPDDMEKQTECREKIWKASGLLLDLVTDVLDMGKLESGEMKLDESPFDIYELIESITAVMENQANSQDITLTTGKIEGEHRYLIGSPVYVRRILVNIISNAIKYNRENGSVTVSCTEVYDSSDPEHTSYKFICSDTGIGMSREFQKHMFDQFTQEKSIGEVSHHGTGLGLAIVKNLVHEMKGSISCESEVGKGTSFCITIPFLIDTDSDKHEPIPEDFFERTLDGISVLLVEDNEMNMEIAEFILEKDGASVIKAWNGREAVDIFSRSDIGEINIILMDMIMPEMDGETATRTIRSLKRADAEVVPIIAMTANAFAEDVQRALDAGMNAHLAKPVDPEQIKRTILYYL